jgi:hypothetical protein
MPGKTGLHHVEIWVAELGTSWPWMLERLGFSLSAAWDGGQTWDAGGAYITLTASPNMTDAAHDRRRAGVNHLAFRGGSPADVDVLMQTAPAHGWVPLYQDRYPHAGGPDHYAGWMENADGFKVEIVAESV